MNESFARSLYAVYANPLPGREVDLHAWYEDVHIPDSFDAGLFESVRRYEAVEEGTARFLTLWGCDYRDEDDALAAVRPVAEGLRSRGRIEVVQEVVFQQFVFLEDVIRERGEGDGRFLTTLHSCWARPDSIPAFDRWLREEPGIRGPEVRAVARYGVPLPGRKALVLLEGGTHAFDTVGTEQIQSGLPPFGPPTPIFASGSPAPGPAPDPPPSDEQMASWQPAWRTRWQLISARQA